MMLKTIEINNFKSFTGHNINRIRLSYQQVGEISKDSKVVLVCHALTGNSNFHGNNGWWDPLIGRSKRIDTNVYTVICFNLPGNGFDGMNNIEPESFELRNVDIAHLFVMALNHLGIHHVHAVIGGSLGGMITWEIAAQYPDFSDSYIPIAANHTASDWIVAFNNIQLEVLKYKDVNSLKIARLIALMTYRSQESFAFKFNKELDHEKNIYQVERYLQYQAEKFINRYQIESYIQMVRYMSSQNLLETVEEGFAAFRNLKGKLIVIGIESDILYPAAELRSSIESLKAYHSRIEYREIKSIHGHDAFLIEFDQLTDLLSDVFTLTMQKTHKQNYSFIE